MNQKQKPKPKPKSTKNHPFDYKSGYKDIPSCIYFYYFAVNTDNKLYTEVYYYDEGEAIAKGQLTDKIKMLIENAASEWPSRQPCGWDFGDVRWRRLSYLVFVHSNPSYKFADNAIEFHDATPNHTFLDGAVIEVPMGGNVKVSAAYCINYMRASDQDVKLETGSQEFRIRVNGLNRIWEYDGGSGTNMGPPIPPPARRKARERQG